jgi:hypothetical protein
MGPRGGRARARAGAHIVIIRALIGIAQNLIRLLNVQEGFSFPILPVVIGMVLLDLFTISGSDLFLAGVRRHVKDTVIVLG